MVQRFGEDEGGKIFVGPGSREGNVGARNVVIPEGRRKCCVRKFCALGESHLPHMG